MGKPHRSKDGDIVYHTIDEIACGDPGADLLDDVDAVFNVRDPDMPVMTSPAISDTTTLRVAKIIDYVILASQGYDDEDLPSMAASIVGITFEALLLGTECGLPMHQLWGELFEVEFNAIEAPDALSTCGKPKRIPNPDQDMPDIAAILKRHGWVKQETLDEDALEGKTEVPDDLPD